MKTLGETAYEACFPRLGPAFGMLDSSVKSEWENAAQAVRAQVIEECAKVCDEWAAEAITPIWRDCAEAIAEDVRLLKEKKET
jgi:hypothetical protein